MKRHTIFVFTILIILGFTPWESLLSIQIRSELLNRFTSAPAGLAGVIGLSITLIIYFKRLKVRFYIIYNTFLGFIATISILFFMLILVLPAFDWNDVSMFRNGNDYLVVQEQETFVTSNVTYPRVIRTPSPYSPIRTVEEQNNLKYNDNRFYGCSVIYAGKQWLKIWPNTK
jgi:hypothetical protein